VINGEGRRLRNSSGDEEGGWLALPGRHGPT
jgi:hypothetical protein